MANSTDTELSTRYWLYVAEGFALFVCNGIIVLSILYHNLLRERKEYALPAALAFCDATEGFSAMLAGFGRNYLIFNGTATKQVSRWDCLFKPWNIGWSFTEQTCDLTLMMISVDRLIAVAWPLFHYGLTRSYGKLLVLLAWGPGIVGICVSVFLTSSYQTKDRDNICFSEYIYSDRYYTFLTSFRCIFSVSSVALYIVIIAVYIVREKAENNGLQSTDLKRYQKNQNTLTMTLGVSCAFTTVFYVIPLVWRWQQLGIDTPEIVESLDLITYSYIIENVHRLANIFLYSLRHRNLRLEIRFLFQRKQLTQFAIDNVIKPVTAVEMAKMKNDV